MESVAESNTDREGCYDVFLSFHDSDTGYGFSDYLYGALCDADISTFRMHETHRGPDKTEAEISKAIEECKVAVVVLSVNYAESKWCLRDLAKIATKRKINIDDIIVIPVYYHVKIDKVKALDADDWCYKETFDKKHKNESEQEEWKEAFAIFKGIDQPNALEQTEERPFHSITIKKALQSISRLVAISRRKAHVSRIIVSKTQNELKELISKPVTQRVRIIMIVGPSGSGKTNIVGHIYNEHKDKFESHHCFLKDVGGNSQQDVVTMRLQQQIVSDIRNRGKPNVEDIHQGSNKVVEVIGEEKVFIVLDNVNSKSEIERLVEGGMDTLKTICKPGSLFIITTTNKHILSESEVTHTYTLDPLTKEDASILFCQHAFKSDIPPEDFDILTDEVVSLAEGLPLTLVILGSLIFNEKNKNLWKTVFNKIKDVPSREVQDRLRIGYDALDYTQKQLFLDIACFFAGTHKEYPIYMWENCGFHPEEGIKTLESRFLITIGEDDNIIRMNEQLIKLGRQIVKEKASEPYYKVQSQRSRLWDQDEALETLTKCQGAEKVEALNLNMKLLASNELEQLTKEEYAQYVARVAEEENQQNQYTYIRRLQGKYFSRLRNLRFLQLGHVSLYGDFRHLFLNLKWLQWTCREEFKPDLSDNTITDMVTPITFFPENLVILDLSNSTITDKWEHWASFKVAENLKVLNLSGCKFIGECPTFFRFLEILNLSSTPLTQINLEPLKTLKALDLSYCDKIKNLDCSRQTQLETLNLLSCTSLAKITGLEKSKKSLKYFDVGGCSSLEKLPYFSGYKHEIFPSGGRITTNTRTNILTLDQACSKLAISNLGTEQFNGAQV